MIRNLGFGLGKRAVNFIQIYNLLVQFYLVQKYIRWQSRNIPHILLNSHSHCSDKQIVAWNGFYVIITIAILTLTKRIIK